MSLNIISSTFSIHKKIKFIFFNKSIFSTTMFSQKKKERTVHDFGTETVVSETKGRKQKNQSGENSYGLFNRIQPSHIHFWDKQNNFTKG